MAVNSRRRTPAWNLEDYHTVFIATIKEQIEQGRGAVAAVVEVWRAPAPGTPRWRERVPGREGAAVECHPNREGATATTAGRPLRRSRRWGGQVRPGEQATPVLFNTVDDELQAQQPPSEAPPIFLDTD